MILVLPSIIYLAIALTSPVSNTIPVFESIVSGLPPVPYVNTHVPQALASQFVVGKLSSYVGLKNMSALE